MKVKMRLDQEGRELIQSFEALRLEPYQDEAGVWTIGWGHTEGVEAKTPKIDIKQARELFEKDVWPCENAVNHFVQIALSQCEFNALVSFVFNLGIGNFSRSTLLRKLNEGDKRGAAKEFDRWVYSRSGPGGEFKISRGLRRRRELEKALFLSAG